jgi:hypothetical protein
MRRLVGRSDPSRQTRMTVEELESRAQPAVLDFTISIHVFENLAPAQAASANAGLPPQANQHAQTEIVVHFGGSSAPPTDSGGSSGSTGSGSGEGSSGTSASSGTTPAFTSPSSFTFVSSGFATSTPNSTFSSVLAREITSQLSAAMPTVATNFTAATLGLLLPPGQPSNATAAPPNTTNPAFLPNAVAAQAFVSEGSRQFPGAASIPYLPDEAPVAFSLFDADAPVAAVPANARPAAVPVKASQRLDRAIEVPADVIAPTVVLQAPVENEEAPAADEPVALAAPVAVDEPVSPWVYASVLGAAAAGTAWVVWQYWLKPPTVARPDDRAWRTYLLGLDFNRL